MTTSLEDIGLDSGGHILIERDLARLAPGGRLAVHGHHPALRVQLAAWCRAEGHALDLDQPAPTIIKGTASAARWRDARRAGPTPDQVVAHADRTWGLAARGALVEPGGPPLEVEWVDRDLVWASVAPRLYAHAAASQWDPATAVRWTASSRAPDQVENAVVQVMTYLVENEQAALIIPAR